MNINTDNYEAFFLDYHEGNLLPTQVEELMLFLTQYPELKEQFNEFEAVALPVVAIPFHSKAELKKQTFITFDNCEEFFIKQVEHTLNTQEEQLLQLFLKTNPDYNKELNLFKKTKLVADTTIVFTNKAALKKTGNQKPAILYYWLAAASVTILVSLYFLLSQEYKTSPFPDIAKSTAIKDKRNNKTNTAYTVVTLPNKMQPALLKNRRPEKTINTIQRKSFLATSLIVVQNTKSVHLEQLSLIPVKPCTQLAIPRPNGRTVATLKSVSPSDAVSTSVNTPEEKAEYLSLTAFAAKRINDRYAVNDSDEDDLVPASKPKTPINLLVSKFIESITGTKTVIGTKLNRDGQVIAYEIAAGNFEFSRSVAK